MQPVIYLHYILHFSYKHLCFALFSDAPLTTFLVAVDPSEIASFLNGCY